MFIVVTVEDKVWLFPEDFADGCNQTTEKENIQLEKAISRRYVDRVIPDSGLCVSLYDIEKIGEALIHSSDFKTFLSQAEFNVVFRLVVFRPFIGEWMEGNILRSSEHGVQASIGFFHDIHIGSPQLMEPAVYSQGTWVWVYRDEETTKPIKYYYEIGARIRFRVVGLVFGDDPTAGSVPFLKVLAAMNETGLGCISWW